MIALSPLVDTPDLHDRAKTGEWAPAFAEIVAMPQIAPWCSYLVRIDDELVATGGFKGPPDARSWVEIAYMTFLPARAGGVATRVAAALVEIAAAQGAAGVCAHTLPEENASTRVLAANGFGYAGEVVDPDDGLIWRWERALG